MGAQTDLFVASDSEIAAAFPGWRKAAPLLPELETRTVRNPFTGVELTIRSRIPVDRIEPDPDATDQPALERFQLVDQKGLSHVNLAQLARALLGWDDDSAQSEVLGRIFSGPDEAGVLSVLPPEMTRSLAALSTDELANLAHRWAALFREDAAGIEADFVRELQLARPDSEWSDRLSALHRLAARAASSSKEIFVWMTA